MAINRLIKTFRAEGAIPAYTIVKVSVGDGDVAPAATALDALIGVTTEVAAADQETCDVVLTGTAFVLLGAAAAVTRGDRITADALGCGVTAVHPAEYIGKALESGVPGQEIEVSLGFGLL